MIVLFTLVLPGITSPVFNQRAKLHNWEQSVTLAFLKVSFLDLKGVISKPQRSSVSTIENRTGPLGRAFSVSGRSHSGQPGGDTTAGTGPDLTPGTSWFWVGV